jgi:hypothetical protein
MIGLGPVYKVSVDDISHGPSGESELGPGVGEARGSGVSVAMILGLTGAGVAVELSAAGVTVLVGDKPAT